MSLDDLKSNWKNAGSESLSEKEIELMTRIGNHPTLKKIRLKLIIEAVLLAALLFAYYDGFDGDKKPVWTNALLVLSILLYLSNNIIGYLFLKKPAVIMDVKTAIDQQVGRLKMISRFSIVCSFFYGIALVTFLTSQIVFDQRKYVMLAGIVITFMLMFYYSWISWKRKIDHFKQMESEF